MSSLFLCYYSPDTFLLDEKPEGLDEVLLEDGFMLPLMAHIQEVELKEEEIIEPLLKQTREIGEMSQPPEGKENCEDCRLLAQLISTV